MRRDPDLARDLLRGEPLADEHQDGALPLGQRVRRGA
jgi:hypothetical protein